MGRILVTGAAGFIGSHLCDALLNRGDDVIGLDNFASGVRENLNSALAQPRFKFVEGSILDSELLANLCQGVDVVFHLAVECVRLSIGHPLQNHAVNATGTLLALEAARRCQVPRFVYCSSSEVYGNCRDFLLVEDTTIPEPVTVYGGAKLAGEHYTKAYHRTYGMDTMIVRPFNTYGPREHYEGVLAEVIPKFIIRALNGKPPLIYGDGANARDFTFVADTVRGLITAAQCDRLIGQVVNIAYGRAITISEIAHAVLQATGQVELTPLYVDPRPGDVIHLHADTRLARQVLGYEATVDFETGLQRTIDWFRSQFPDPSVLLAYDLEKAWAEVEV
jgi:UDP-glucose 4-epimerase